MYPSHPLILPAATPPVTNGIVFPRGMETRARSVAKQDTSVKHPAVGQLKVPELLLTASGSDLAESNSMPQTV